ncbi:GTP-binding protein ypt2 [Cyclospora cayetanensis]|uniref:GTP-binding protein ypt2 n=1 Tax=Cyclospora cayetanensis TaxID=88456 RepID=A0A6P6RZ06_9EIME|nr:GTP-binding protein ypt2 [Cyclospora cayetanensis]
MSASATDVVERALELLSGDERRTSALGYDYLVKLLLIGDSNVGKSSMLMRFTEGPPRARVGPSRSNGPPGATKGGPPPPTISIDYVSKTLQVERKIAKVQVWDTAGHERFKSVAHVYFRGAMGVMLVFDLGCKRSFLSAPRGKQMRSQGAGQ